MKTWLVIESLAAVLIILVCVLLTVENVHGEQVQKCSFLIWFCHMEEHSTTKCDKGKFLGVHEWDETYYIHAGNVLIPETTHHTENIYQFDCIQHYDNGTEITWVEKRSD